MGSDLSSGKLVDIGVLVTRPVEQAMPLCRLIEMAGGTAVKFPALEIVDPQDRSSLMALIEQFDRFDLAIFVSPNAVNRALKLLSPLRLQSTPVKLAVVGKGSAKALLTHGLMPDIVPERNYNSESLLALNSMQALEDKHVVIFRGVGGREVLADTLKERGATVEYAECYCRIQPKTKGVGQLLQRWTEGEINIVSVTSNEGLRNLYDMVGQSGRTQLQSTPLVVVSQRAVQLANELGFEQNPIVCEASNEAIVDAIVGWRAAQVA